jgi:hypothetical protein
MWLDSRRAEGLLYSPKCQGRLWHPPSFLLNSYSGTFPGRKFAWMWRETTHLYYAWFLCFSVDVCVFKWPSRSERSSEISYQFSTVCADVRTFARKMWKCLYFIITDKTLRCSVTAKRTFNLLRGWLLTLKVTAYKLLTPQIRSDYGAH